MRKKWVTIILLFLILFVAASLIILRHITKQSQTPLVTNQSQQSTRGWKEDGNDTVFYQFPARVLSEVRLEDDTYKIKVSPFDSLYEEFDLYLGLESSTIPFGTCTFSETGEISGTATWTNQKVTSLKSKLSIGDWILIRLTYPTNPVGDKVQYTQELIKRIEKLENKQEIDFIFPNKLCKEQSL